MATRPKNAKSVAQSVVAEAPLPASGIKLEDGFVEGKVFDIEYHLTCKSETFNAFEGHKSFVEDLGHRSVTMAVGQAHIEHDGSFSTKKALQLVRDQILIPEFPGHEAIDIKIVNINSRSYVPTFIMP